VTRPRGDDPFGLRRVAPRHRTEHRVTPPPGATQPPGDAGPGGGERREGAAQPGPQPGEPRADARCAACPVAVLAHAWHELEPEAVDRLLAATHELLALARVVIDVADGVVEDQRRARSGRPRVRRLDVQ
jgi:hypothetical protein